MASLEADGQLRGAGAVVQCHQSTSVWLERLVSVFVVNRSDLVDFERVVTKSLPSLQVRTASTLLEPSPQDHDKMTR